MKEIYSYIPENIENGKNFHLDTFLKENNIDRNNPEIAEKIANFEKSLQNQKKLTRDLLLTMLAYHGISAIYSYPKVIKVTDEKNLQNINIEEENNQNSVKYATENTVQNPKMSTEKVVQSSVQKKPEAVYTKSNFHQEGRSRMMVIKEEKQKTGIDVSQQTRLLDEYRQNEWERQKIIAKYGSKEAVMDHYNKLTSIIRNSAYDWMWLLTQEIGLSGHPNKQDYYEHQRQVLQKYLDDNPDIKIAVEEKDYLLELFGYGFFNRPASKTSVDGDRKKIANQDINYNDGNWHNHPNISGVQIRRSGNIQEARGDTVHMESSGNGTTQYINSIVID